MRYSSNKMYVENWLEDSKYQFTAVTLGKGHRGVHLYLHGNCKIDEFIKEYSGTKSDFATFYVTKNHITKNYPLYVSIRKFGFNYGGINIKQK